MEPHPKSTARRSRESATNAAFEAPAQTPGDLCRRRTYKYDGIPRLVQWLPHIPVIEPPSTVPREPRKCETRPRKPREEFIGFEKKHKNNEQSTAPVEPTVTPAHETQQREVDEKIARAQTIDPAGHRFFTQQKVKQNAGRAQTPKAHTNQKPRITRKPVIPPHSTDHRIAALLNAHKMSTRHAQNSDVPLALPKELPPSHEGTPKINYERPRAVTCSTISSVNKVDRKKGQLIISERPHQVSPYTADQRLEANMEDNLASFPFSANSGAKEGAREKTSNAMGSEVDEPAKAEASNRNETPKAQGNQRAKATKAEGLGHGTNVMMSSLLKEIDSTLDEIAPDWKETEKRYRALDQAKRFAAIKSGAGDSELLLPAPLRINKRGALEKDHPPKYEESTASAESSIVAAESSTPRTAQYPPNFGFITSLKTTPGRFTMDASPRRMVDPHILGRAAVAAKQKQVSFLLDEVYKIDGKAVFSRKQMDEDEEKALEERRSRMLMDLIRGQREIAEFERDRDLVKLLWSAGVNNLPLEK
ncbi:hypothetical protein EJ06DRAFT_525262 [Trichodelitschia bisporula]|uniref:Uncharacterized protein n=1 Tax=Trichodelitschia bisporula TaxID=703511 RepID=A0A6G1HIF1_9PEZI|nr:hypothetical protein EJ06DRAFT_525262 [Trichodelitschia bisporula]